MSYNLEVAKERIRNISPSKNNPLYNSHIYWSQKAFNVCDILIEELTNEGETIFDPFMGSGVSILEAVQKKYCRKAIGCEINDAPLTIVKILLKQYDLSQYHKDAVSLIEMVKRLSHYYETICPVCGEVGYSILTMFDLENRKALPELKTVNMICPNCKRQAKKPDSSDFEKMTAKYEILHINNNERMIENSKLAVYKGESISQIFTSRNFKVIDEIISLIDKFPKNRDAFRYVLMSILHLCKITDTHSNSQWPLWIPKKNCVEKNAVEIFCKKILKFEETISYIGENYDDSKEFKLLKKGSQHINSEDIADESVRLIITDPPYLGQVAYSEYMQLYKPFLGLDYNLEDEIIVTSTPSRKKTEKDYFQMLNQVFEMCSKKIVTGGYFCMYFHDCNLNVWNKLIKIMADNHFKYLSQEHIKKTNTLKNIISPKKSLSGDAILFFVKEHFNYKAYYPSESMTEIEANVVQHVKKTIKIQGPKTTPELYDEGLMEYLIYNDWLDQLSKKYKTLVDIFEKYLIWNLETNKWELAE